MQKESELKERSRKFLWRNLKKIFVPTKLFLFKSNAT